MISEVLLRPGPRVLICSRRPMYSYAHWGSAVSSSGKSVLRFAAIPIISSRPASTIVSASVTFLPASSAAAAESADKSESLVRVNC